MYVGLVEPLAGIDLMFGPSYSATCKLKGRGHEEEVQEQLLLLLFFSNRVSDHYINRTNACK